MSSLLLLSGGLDSAALAALYRPDSCLYVDYGQRPAAGEAAAAQNVAAELGLPLSRRDVDLSALGTGLLVGRRAAAVGPTPEWFPFRNQLLVTIAAAVAAVDGFTEVWIGLTVDDRSRHADGSPAFVDAIDAVTSLQEGGVKVCAPAIDVTSAALVADAALPAPLLASTTSCHVATHPCGQCPGCLKRREVLGGASPE